MKKYILGLILTIGCIFNFTKGAEIIENCYTPEGQTTRTLRCFKFTTNETIVLNNTNLNEEFKNSIAGNLQFTYYGETTEKTFYFGNFGGNTKYYQGIYWNNNNLYLYFENSYNNQNNIRTIDKVCTYNGTDYNGLLKKCGFSQQSTRDNCSIIESNYTITTEQFIENVNSINAEEFILTPGAGYGNVASATFNYGAILCGKYNNVWYCIPIINTQNSSFCQGYTTQLENQSGSNGTAYNNNKSNFGNSPIQGYIGGTQNDGNRKNYYCPTIRQLMNNMGANYNTGLCYNSTLRYNNGQIITVEKKDIFTVFENYTEYVNRIDIYNNQCRAPNTIENCNNAFSGNFEKYSIIANAINSNVYPKKLWNYCNMGLNYDLNATTCVASGIIAEKPTPEELRDDITDGIEKINTPNQDDTGNVLNSLLGTGQTRDDIATRDILGQIEQIKDKLQTLFTNRNGVNGIIPDYILRIILLTLLLTVLLKK